MDNLEERLENIESLLLSQKTVFNFDEVASYTNLSKSYLYKLTSTGGIPCYKPLGKHIYFNKLEIDQWLQRNPKYLVDKDKLEEKASTYISVKKMGQPSNQA